MSSNNRTGIGLALTLATAVTGLGFLAPGGVRDFAAAVIAICTPLAVYIWPIGLTGHGWPG
jgi:hypothetical protein